MKIYIGSDHAGFALKKVIIKLLQQEGYPVEDEGAYMFDSNDDYPDFVSKVAKKVSLHPQERGIVIGGTGQAEQIVANKFPHVRAALFYGTVFPIAAVNIEGDISHDPLEIIVLSRQHNDTNVLSLGARFLSEEDAKKAVIRWLTTPFSDVERHKRRIAKISTLEK